MRYGTGEPVNAKPWATSVLIKTKSAKFLISASHVINNLEGNARPQDLGIMIEDNFHFLNGRLKYSSGTDSDKIDLAIWHLQDEGTLTDIERKYSFLDIENGSGNSTVPQRPLYLLAGFPVSRSRLKPQTRRIVVNPFIFSTREAKSWAYENNNFNPQVNILVEYRKRKIRNHSTGKIQQGPNPSGLSGCGLWHLSSGGSFLLTGIMSEWRRESNSLVGTRIEVAAHLLRTEFGF